MAAKHNKRGMATADQILDGAEEVLLANGVTGLTLNAVAEKVGISKGGLLYHFPSKEALESSLHNRFVASMGRRLSERERTAGSFLSAMLAETSIDKSQGSRRFAALMLSAANGEPPKTLQAFGTALLEQLGMSYAGGPYKRVAFFAIMGIVLSNLLNLIPLSNEESAEIRLAIDMLINDDRWGTTVDPPA
ncbi:TetR/AcrR family transcriptional regulator [Phyllobacterium bourgognense]|uniref:TetR family transcriptional regulator n=1 Tax=Phyllobacterium bourgognense TaxID=314236 RepID=A0A368YES2_9HYPH|nr:TetR/AcrR family transcriptional regulator [Phyllobacterium bourgognense]RCW78741.1 TetR family transcriptional regulator [Phyllobacterium bourgognense]